MCISKLGWEPSVKFPYNAVGYHCVWSHHPNNYVLSRQSLPGERERVREKWTASWYEQQPQSVCIFCGKYCIFQIPQGCLTCHQPTTYTHIYTQWWVIQFLCHFLVSKWSCKAINDVSAEADWCQWSVTSCLSRYCYRVETAWQRVKRGQGKKDMKFRKTARLSSQFILFPFSPIYPFALSPFHCSLTWFIVK